MYTDYFGFREQPFNVAPSSRFFYANPDYQEAYATLLYGIRERKGFVVLTGEVGTGKTTLLRRLMVNLEANVRFVFFYNTTLTFEELVSFTCQEFGLAIKDKGRLEQIQELNTFLLEQFANGGNAALLIDEAQNLKEEVLENLRLLSNLEMAGEKLLQIVLVGQPELGIKLDQPVLRQVKQRITLQCHLGCLEEREVGPFIHYRLRAAGHEHEDLFAPQAIQRITLYAQGIPRLINIICDNALLIAYATSQKMVSAAMIDEVAHDLQLEGDRRAAEDNPLQAEVSHKNGSWEGVPIMEESLRQRRRPAWVAPLTILLLVGGGVAAFYPLPTRNHLADFGLKARELLNGIGGHQGSSTPAVKQFNPPEATEGEQDRLPAKPTPEEMSESKPSALGASPAVGVPPVPSTQQQETPPKDTQPLDFLPTVKLKEEAVSTGEALGWSLGTLLTPPSAETWKENPLVIRYGSTISRIAADVYGTNLFLAIDILKEFNTHIGNLNWVLAGQKLWLPPLSQEILLRKQKDSSYRFILGSFRSLVGAEQFARAVRRKGYSVSITPRRVSDDFLLYRVEIIQLKNSETASRAWDTARTQRWLTVSDGREEQQKQLNY
jgi:type II secretory pathway predicted ATPase ExeA